MQMNLFLEENQAQGALLGICEDAESGMTSDRGRRCQTQTQMPALLLIICVTLYNFFNLSKPRTFDL